jgi:hypothetical protein
MKPYQFIQINQAELITNKLYSYIIEKTDILEKRWDWNTLILKDVLAYVPELEEECAKVIPAPITMVSIVHRNPGAVGGVHIDVGNYNYRILWPIKNCAGSYTRFYDLNGNKIITTYGKQGDEFKTISKDYALVEIDAVELIAPIIFNTQVPHGVYTNPNFTESRLTATIGFGTFPLEILMNSN